MSVFSLCLYPTHLPVEGLEPKGIMQSIPARPIDIKSLAYEIIKTPVGLMGIAATEKEIWKND